MLKRRDINADPRRLPARIAAVVADRGRWPFEQLAWFVEERLLWPLGDLFAERAPSTRVLGAGALGAVAVAALVAGALLVGGDEPTIEAEQQAASEPTLAVTPAATPVERPSKPTLQGVSPSFGTGAKSGGDVGTSSPGSADADAGAGASEATGELNAGGGEPAATAKLSSAPNAAPAGPVAMRVARRFAEAFVFYEVGERPQRAETVFGETATPRLAKALAARPPRQPASGEVPKARVLNLVPGPRSGRTFAISAALLRVGEISELRMELRKRQGDWRVTDVRG